MSNPYQVADFHYVCDRCKGEEFGPTTGVENAKQAMFKIALDDWSFRDGMIGGSLLWPKFPHHCKDGGQGIARIVGYRVRTEGS